MADERIVVLGGSGFVGRHIVSRLGVDEQMVVVPTRRREAAKHLILLPTVEVIEADIHDEPTLTRLVRGAGTVINLIGILNETRKNDFEKVHVHLVEKLVRACAAGGVPRLLHISALGADANGPSRYLQTKGKAEQVITASTLSWTIFQPSVIFGPEDSFLNLFARLQRFLPVVPLACPQARFQPVYVGDVAQVLVSAIDNLGMVGHRYPLCGPTVYTLRDLVTYVGMVTEYERPIIGLPAPLARIQAWMLEHLPGKLMSRDNLASMRVDNVCPVSIWPKLGLTPTALEAVAPRYLSPQSLHSAYDSYRVQSGR